MSMDIHTRRRIGNGVALVLASVAAVIGAVALALILWTLLSRGLAGIEWSVFTEHTPGPGTKGGLANAIIGSLIMVVAGTALGTPLGMLAGTYLAEFGRESRLGHLTRSVSDMLLSAPSIIIGLFVYELCVMPIGHFSGWAGAIALAIIVIPIVLRTTEDMLRLVPDTLRESALALGAPHWKVVVKVAYRAARSGIATGLLLAIARISGETAPLLFTALNNQFTSLDVNRPMASLPVVIFQFAMSPYEDWQQLAWTGALLITFSVLALNITARIGLRSRKA